jgi:DNA-binding PadR family transcriptional regulator
MEAAVGRWDNDTNPVAEPGSVRWHVLTLLAQGYEHGYEIWRELVAQGFTQSRNPTAVYRALRAMNQEGLVSSEWEFRSVGPARRVYRLTQRGRRALKE